MSLSCLHLYELLFNCNKIGVAWNICFVIFILFSGFPAIFSHAWFTTGGSKIFVTGEVTVKSISCGNVKNTLRQKS